MKKVLKISGIAFGVIAVAAVIIIVFFPGLFTYIKVKHDYPSIDITMKEFKTVEIPQDFVEYEVGDIIISVPGSYTQKDYGFGFVSENDETVMGIYESDKLELIKTAEILGEPYDQWEYYDYEEDDYRSYFRAVDAPYPTLYDARTELLWYIRETLKAKDCLKLRGKDRDVFLEFADAKEGSLRMEDSWKLNIDGGTAYVSRNLDDDILDHFYTSISIFPDNGGSEYWYIMINKENDEIVNQIVSSIRLAD